MSKLLPSTRTTAPYSQTYRLHDGTGTTIVLDGKPVEGLGWDEIRRMKDVAVTRHKYKRATILEMTEAELAAYRARTTSAPAQASPPIGGFAGEGNPSYAPNPDPQLEHYRARAVAAARPAAQAAQARHDAAKAGMPVTPIVQLPPVDEALEDDEFDSGLDDAEVEDLLGGGRKLSPEDHARAQAEADRDFPVVDAAGKALYQQQNPNPTVPWDQLDEKLKQSYRWQAIELATAPQG